MKMIRIPRVEYEFDDLDDGLNPEHGDQNGILERQCLGQGEKVQKQGGPLRNQRRLQRKRQGLFHFVILNKDENQAGSSEERSSISKPCKEV
jgi:hypothetical protein